MTSIDDDAAEAEALRRITEKFECVSAWAARSRTAWLPSPESDLAADDAVWPAHIPTSQLARAGLVAGTDNLRAMCHHIDLRVVSPFATESLCRTAVLGAAQGVWILEPGDGAERVRRAQILTTYSKTNEASYLGILERNGGKSGAQATVRRAMVKAQLDTLIERRDAAGDQERFEATAVIRRAGGVALGESGKDAAEAYWRLSSAFAHGLPWGVQVSPDRTDQNILDGHTTFGMRPTARRLQEGFSIAVGMLEVGWSLLDERGGPSHRHQPGKTIRGDGSL